MADVKVTFTFPEAQVPRVIEACMGLYPKEVGEVSEEGGEPEELFSDAAWAKECGRRFYRDTVRRWENKVALEAAAVDPDDNVVS